MIPVMIVEDEFLVRLGLKSLVDWNSYGFYIAADASDGAEGFSLYQKYKPYLIITDIRMSPVSGLEMMKKIRAIDSNVKFIIISAYNDFEYAREAICYGVELYLCKSSFTNDDLAEILPKISLEYKRDTPADKPDTIAALLNFESIFPDALDSEGIMAQFNKAHLDGGPVYALASRFDRHDRNRPNRQLQQTLLENSLNHIGIPYQLYERQDFLLALCRADTPDILVQEARKIHHTLCNYTMSPCFFGISNPFISYAEQLFRAVSEACLACNEFIFDKTLPVRLFSSKNTAVSYKNLNLDICIEQLMSSVFAMQQDKTEEILKQIVESCENYRSLEKALFTILFSFIEYDNSSMISSLLEKHLKKDNLESITQSLCHWIYNLPFNAIPIGSSTSKYVDTVIHYIRTHLAEPLSNHSLAAMVHLSPNYLGKIFYQETGTFISNYITGYRMNKACELLTQTDLPVNTIGNMVGITNPYYFSKLFRDTIGVSPSKYRTNCH